MATVEVSGCTSQEDLNLSLADQIKEALGPVNVWYFKEKYPYVFNPSADQLMEYYIKNGGAKGHRQREIEFRLLQQEKQNRCSEVELVAQG